MDRSHLYRINRAMKTTRACDAWQIAQTKKAQEEADAGDFATEEEIVAMDEKWGYSPRLSCFQSKKIIYSDST